MTDLKEYKAIKKEIIRIYMDICTPCMKSFTYKKGDCDKCETMKKYISLQQKKREMTEIEKKTEQPEITIHPEGYDHCACCPNCMSRDICSLGEFGDFGVCLGYKYDGSSEK